MATALLLLAAVGLFAYDLDIYLGLHAGKVDMPQPETLIRGSRELRNIFNRGYIGIIFPYSLYTNHQ